MRKRGATSLLTNGRVVDIWFEVEVDSHWFDDQIHIMVRAPSVAWILPGDSGSIVIETVGNTHWVVGLNHAGTQDGIWGVANHWAQIVNALNQTVPHMVELG